METNLYVLVFYLSEDKPITAKSIKIQAIQETIFSHFGGVVRPKQIAIAVPWNPIIASHKIVNKILESITQNYNIVK